jgi:hypothetical protein
MFPNLCDQIKSVIYYKVFHVQYYILPGTLPIKSIEVFVFVFFKCWGLNLCPQAG